MLPHLFTITITQDSCYKSLLPRRCDFSQSLMPCLLSILPITLPIRWSYRAYLFFTYVIAIVHLLSSSLTLFTSFSMLQTYCLTSPTVINVLMYKETWRPILHDASCGSRSWINPTDDPFQTQKQSHSVSGESVKRSSHPQHLDQGSSWRASPAKQQLAQQKKERSCQTNKGSILSSEEKMHNFYSFRLGSRGSACRAVPLKPFIPAACFVILFFGPGSASCVFPSFPFLANFFFYRGRKRAQSKRGPSQGCAVGRVYLCTNHLGGRARENGEPWTFALPFLNDLFSYTYISQDAGRCGWLNFRRSSCKLHSPLSNLFFFLYRRRPRVSCFCFLFFWHTTKLAFLFFSRLPLFPLPLSRGPVVTPLL